MNIAQAKCIPLKTYLARQGHSPKKARQGGRELWYHSPIRTDDDHPSFKIDTLKNLWYDHGLATGGNIIDLVREIFACDVRDALRHLERSQLYSPPLAKPQNGLPRGAETGRILQLNSLPGTPLEGRNLEGEKQTNGAFELIEEKRLEHPALRQYLAKRGIDLEIAREYVSEIHFKAPQGAKSYFSLVTQPEAVSRRVAPVLRASLEMGNL